MAGATTRRVAIFNSRPDFIKALTFVWVGVVASLTGPLRWFPRTREAFFWRLKRDLRKQRTIV